MTAWMAARRTELENITEEIVPLHCRSLFPNERVEDFIWLPDAGVEKMAALCTWQPLTPAKLT